MKWRYSKARSAADSAIPSAISTARRSPTWQRSPASTPTQESESAPTAMLPSDFGRRPATVNGSATDTSAQPSAPAAIQFDWIDFPDNPSCICARVIPSNAAYYAFQLDPDNDTAYAFISEWHENCLAEWGWQRSDTEFGIGHGTSYCKEQADEDIGGSYRAVAPNDPDRLEL